MHLQTGVYERRSADFAICIALLLVYLSTAGRGTPVERLVSATDTVHAGSLTAQLTLQATTTHTLTTTTPTCDMTHRRAGDTVSDNTNTHNSMQCSYSRRVAEIIHQATTTCNNTGVQHTAVFAQQHATTQTRQYQRATTLTQKTPTCWQCNSKCTVQFLNMVQGNIHLNYIFTPQTLRK